MTRTTKKRESRPSDEIRGWTVVSVAKVPMSKECARVKNRPISIICMVVADATGAILEDKDRMLTMLIPADAPRGDASRFQNEILRYISLYNTYSPEEDRKCANRILEMAKEKRAEDSIGVDIIQDLLSKSFMEEYGYNIWTV